MGPITKMCICYCPLCFLLIATFITTITLSFVGLKPKLYIQHLYIPALNNSTEYNPTNLNNSIFIDLKFKRVVAYIPLRYEDLNITLFYGSNKSFSVGHYVVPGFGQGHKKTARRKAVLEAHGLPWEEALQKISGGLTVALAVELAMTYRVERCDMDGDCSYTDPDDIEVAADVVVDGSGHKVSKKPIRLH